ncbi:MAG: amino acid permease [Sphingobacteriaceae bacterium]|nr:MAG: amino acid permease [Sphingobacteriaceae bacterium]
MVDAGEPTTMKRELTLMDATLLVVGSMIGSGIFIVTADMTRNVGSVGWLILVWVITGIMTLVAAVTYGELSGMFPKAGGQYVYLKEAFNPLVGFLYGWSFFTVIQSGLIAAVGVSFSKFTAYFIPALSEDNILFSAGSFTVSAAQLFAIALIAGLTYINTRGVKGGKIIQTTFTLTKLLSLFGLIVFGFIMMNTDAIAANWGKAWDLHRINIDGSIESYTTAAAFGAIAAAMVGSIFASDAWNSVTFIAGEVVNPKKNIGLSLLLGTLIVTVIYLLANLMYAAVLPMNEIAGAEKDRVGVAAAQSAFGPIGTGIIALMIMISTFGCNNGLVLSGARVYYTMAKDGLFFKATGHLNKNAVPEVSLWLQCVMASILCLTGKYGDLLDMVSFVVVIFYILTIAGVYILRVKQPHTPRPYKAFGYPVLPAIYICLGLAFCTLLIIYKPGFTWPGLIIVLTGVPIYYLTKSKTPADIQPGSM